MLSPCPYTFHTEVTPPLACTSQVMLRARSPFPTINLLKRQSLIRNNYINRLPLHFTPAQSYHLSLTLHPVFVSIMPHPRRDSHTCLVESETCHPRNPIPEEPTNLPKLSVPSSETLGQSNEEPSSSYEYPSSSDTTAPDTPATDPATDELSDDFQEQEISDDPAEAAPTRRASTVLISQGPEDVRRLLLGSGDAETNLIEKVCCGGGCCFLDKLPKVSPTDSSHPVILPDNEAFRSLNLTLGPLTLDSELSKLVELPPENISFRPSAKDSQLRTSTAHNQPPKFVTPHPPYEVYPAKVHHARELTKPGALKRTFHFDLDVTDYPVESGKIDFVVGGAIGVCPPNSDEVVDNIFQLLSIPNFIRDKPVILETKTGRWPTIWGDEKPRELITTRRELLTWCSDLQSYPPTKALLRLLGECAENSSEKKILFYLASAQGQAAFCDLRTGPHLTITQLLAAFPSSHPPLAHLLSVLGTLMPRFYSLSQDPQISREREGLQERRLIEIAVTVHEVKDWRGGLRTGVASGFFERIARKIIDAEGRGIKARDLDIRVPMFRGLMANPLAREFVSDGPMLLIGAGVGVAPFRGFVQRRLKSANCVNKVWVLQGVRDSLLDELYSGEWGVEESKVKKVVQSRRGEGRYVQEEVRHQADLVWYIINSIAGRIFVCGSSEGMGQSVERALVDVAIDKGGLNLEEAGEFWKRKKEAGQYIAVSVEAASVAMKQLWLVTNYLMQETW